MPLVVLGANHKTAKLELRERWSYQATEITTTLKKLSNRLKTNEIVLLSTCNRTEVYCDIDNTDDIISWFNQEIQPITSLDLQHHGYFYQDKAAVSHIMRVAAGLDSLVVGEPEILGQFKQAYGLAQKAKTVGKKLDKLFNQALNTAKFVRTNTELGQYSMSVASTSTNIILNEFGKDDQYQLNALQILLIGSGDTIKTVGRTLIKKNITRISIVNRNPLHANDLADDLINYARDELNQEININIHDFNILTDPTKLQGFNVIFSATRSPLYLLTKDIVEKIVNNKKLLLIDLAVPRDIDPKCSELKEVCLYTVDDLQAIVNNNKAQRLKEAAKAEEIIKCKVEEFCSWESSLLLMASLCQYREQAELMCEDVIEKAQKRLDSGQDPSEVLISSLQLLRNKLLHHPTMTLKTMVKNNTDMEILKDLFNL